MKRRNDIINDDLSKITDLAHNNVSTTKSSSSILRHSYTAIGKRSGIGGGSKLVLDEDLLLDKNNSFSLGKPSSANRTKLSTSIKSNQQKKPHEHQHTHISLPEVDKSVINNKNIVLDELPEKEIIAIYHKYFPRGTKVAHARCGCGHLHPFITIPDESTSSVHSKIIIRRNFVNNDKVEKSTTRSESLVNNNQKKLF